MNIFVNLIILSTASLTNKVDIGGTSELTSLIGGYKNIAGIIIGIGFLFAGIGVLSKIINDQENGKKSLLHYLIALFIFIAIWTLV